jgi:WD repeat-containing protein 35
MPLLAPLYVGISQTHVIACNSNAIYVWHYRAISNVSSTDFNLLLNRALETNDKLIHVDERVVSSDVDSDKINKMTSDPISGVAVSEHVMTIGRLSGDVLVYELPGCDLTVSFNVGCQPLKLSLNVDSSKLSVIDNNGIFSLYDMKERVKLGHDRKEVWNMVWSDDDSELFAIMEKTRMYIFRGAEPEEPIVSSAIICCFSNLQVKGLLIDELMKNPESPSLSLMFDFESKSLRDTRKLLDKVGFEDTFQFINDNPHVRLWELLAESALKAFNFDIAEKSFVKCKNYAGIQFVKKLKKLTNDDIRRAQIAGFYGNFDEAEKIYLHIDRKDLAIDMRTKLCDWFRVTQLMSGGGSHGNDKQLANAWKCLGDHYSERHMWYIIIDACVCVCVCTCVGDMHWVIIRCLEMPMPLLRPTLC